MAQHSMERLIGVGERKSEEWATGSVAVPETRPVVLLVDDDELAREGHRRILTQSGTRTIGVPSAKAALALLENADTPFDVVVSDIVMPEMDGIGLLREIRRCNMDIPIILVTGNPQLESAMDAINSGGFRYFTKPVGVKELVAAVRAATSLHRLARLKREALDVLHAQRRLLGDRASLEVHFQDAIDGLWVAFQPIVDWSGRRLFGYEALVRSASTVITTPMALLGAAERLSRVHDVGRRVRALVAESAAKAPPGVLLFVNLHAADLDDPDLVSPRAPLSAVADRVVLEITERSSLEHIHGVSRRMDDLRRLGYQVAVDDLGAGYAGLTSFTTLEPDVVKLDMSLIRGIDGSRRQQSIVRSMISVCGRELGVLVVCEGVETEAERATLEELGANLLQGYLFARPEAGFDTCIPGILSAQDDSARAISQ